MGGQEKAILINCPITGKPVLTGLFATTRSFKTLMINTHKVNCHHCGQVHTWSKNDAYLAGEKRSSSPL